MKKQQKIYTKKGDQGNTSLAGGSVVPKYHERIEAYGTLDELNSFIGLIRDHDIGKRKKDSLLAIQKYIFAIEAILANEKSADKNFPVITSSEILFIEKEIDFMNNDLPELTAFILPGGHPLVSFCHIARTICRRAERIIVRLSVQVTVEPEILRYINRLSDYLFVLARSLSRDLGTEESKWEA
jgi:cob(I)alamin adenosyltransferase